MKKLIKFSPTTITVITTLFMITAYYLGIPFFDLIELKTIDLRFKWRGKINKNEQIVLAVIDEKSLTKEGKWIWPRSKIADLINKLSQAGAKVIALDIGFLEPDEKSVVKTIENIEGDIQKFCPQDSRLRDHLKNLKIKSDYDILLAEAVKNSSAKVVLGYFFRMEKAPNEEITNNILKTHQENILSSRYMFVRYSSQEAEKIKVIEANFPQSNIKTISSEADYSGYFNMVPDPDGIVRRVPMVVKFKEAFYAPLSIMAASAYMDTPPSLQIADYGIESLKIGKLFIPVDEKGRMLVNYRGPQFTFPHISITDILNGNVPQNNLKGKIVLVGATAIGIYDMRAIPFEPVYPGLEVQATLVENILSNDFLSQPAWGAVFDVIAIIFEGLALGLILTKFSITLGAISAILLFVIHILLCTYVFSSHGWILNMFYPLTTILTIYLPITIHQYMLESKQKRFIKNAFSTYLAPSVVNQLLIHPEQLTLGGEERKITAFFSDIQGFTGISEKLNPKALVELLNEFLTEMTDIVLRNQGTVDKFIGDAIVAFFGAPNDLEKHAEVACIVSIEMQKTLVRLREKWKKEGKAEIRMRIGLCTGSAVIGNMGSKTRMNYTMMGDTVNTASRLEGVNKVYGTYILISETTYKEIVSSGKFLCRELDSINVVGKTAPVSIYQVIGYASECDEKTRKVIEHYSIGLWAYRNQDWDKAIKFFKTVLQIVPDDGPSKTMLARSRDFKINPPPPNWNGASAMKEK
ncbi:MAG: CHASE2 domain-containing protein [Desulfobacterales bacterium]|nr:CHASE2 domain-containing protein [Desulfobacterales bacterium]MBF0395283.1 CHASE2 domain-containing protein [Desulfobacterales bacterium]